MQATHADFANKLYGTAEISKSARFAKPKLDQTGFTIQHYAGAVSYRTGNFLAKNKDFVVAEHQQLMQNSTVSFVRALFPAEDEPADKVTRLPSSFQHLLTTPWVSEEVLEFLHVFSELLRPQ